MKMYELTKPQQSIWVTEQYCKGTPIGNICGSVTIQEVIDFNKLNKAINMFIEKNDSFRTKLTYIDDNIMQYFAEHKPLNIDIVNVNNDEDVKNLENNMVSIPFQLTDTLLFKFNMFKFNDNHGGFIINAHHLIADAWTARLVVNEIMDFYNELDDLHISSYSNYITSELEYLSSDKYSKDKIFWNNLFENLPEAAQIPTILQNSDISYEAKREQFVIDKDVVDSINTFCNNNRVSIFNFFMAIYSIYIGRVSNMSEFIIGTPVLNRSNFKEKHATGMFVSTVPFKVNLSNSSFKEFVNKVSSDFMQIFRHQKYPYQDLLQDLRKKDSNIPRLYNILFSYQNAKSNKQSSDIPYDSRWLSNNCLFDDINIHLYDMDDTGSLNVAYDYSVSKYSVEDITSMHNRILYIIKQIIDNNEINIVEIDIVTPEENEKVLYKFNNTSTYYPKDKSISQLFEEQVEKTPDNIALVCKGELLTYKELNEKANSLAHYLINKGLGKNDIIAIMVNRSFEMIISILAVLKIGACYLPIDPEYPDTRIKYMLKNSSSKLMLSLRKLSEKCDLQNTIFVDLSNNDIYSSPNINLEMYAKPNDLAYLIYTSGSTGLPKGVMLKQSNINNFIQGMSNVIDFSSNKTIVSVTTICFDIFVLETLLPLQKGLKIVIATEEEQNNISAFNILCLKNNVNIIQTTPSRYQALISDSNELDYFRTLTDILIGGEPLPPVLLSKLKSLSNSRANIYNVYGPTETAVWSTIKDMTFTDTINIGKPIANTYCYILDDNRNLLPPLVPGKLFIGGEGVSAGYYMQPDLTQEKFILNPYIENQLIYDTGDLAYFTNSGELVHLGRNDFQVKIRGYRIELGEVEEVIAKYNGIIQNTVIGIDNKYLICYYISDKEIQTEHLSNFLMEKLPTYMIPTYFQRIYKMPMTPNGKIDKKQLPKIKNSDISKNYELAHTSTEKSVVEAIQKLLELPNSDIDINAPFLSLGLDSLNLIQLQGALLYLGYNLTTQDFYKFPNIKKLANYIDTEKSISNEIPVFVPDIMKHTDSFNIDFSLLNENVLGNVFLTGANGFIGIHILYEILNTTNSNVYCLVRGKDIDHSISRLAEKYKFYFNKDLCDLLNKRVFVMNGDVALADFNLSNSDYLILKNNIDTIIHSAAIVKHYGDLNKFIKVNVDGTKHVTDFAYANNKRFIHLSSLSVSGNYLVKQNNTNIRFTENDLYIGQHYTENVYVNSKYQAEQYIYSYIEKGLDAKIIRLGILSGRYSDGVFQENIAENAFYSRIKSMIVFSKISENMLEQHIEFTPIDYCARAILLLSKSPIGKNKIFHLYNHNLCTIGNIVDRLRLLNINIEILSQADFDRSILEMSKFDFKNAALQGIANDLTVNNDNSVNLNYDFSVNLKSNFTEKYLENFKFTWPKCDDTYIDKMLHYMKKVDFI